MNFTQKIIAILILLVGSAACSPGLSQDSVNTTGVEKEVEVPAATMGEIPTGTREAQATPAALIVEPSMDSTPQADSDPAGGILTLWHGLDGDGALALGDIVQGFQQQAPDIQVKLVYIPYDDLVDQYIAKVNAGEGPSLILGAGEWRHIFYDRGVSKEVSNLVSSALVSTYSPPATAMASYSETMVGLPVMLSGVVLYRNKEILKEAPESMETLIASAQEVTNPETLGAYLERGSLFAIPQLTACGGQLMYPNGYPAFNNQAGICWLDLLESFDEAGAVAFNSDDDLNRFQAGKVGMIIDGTWNLMALSVALGDDLVVDPWPQYADRRLSGFVWSENIYLNPNMSVKELYAAVNFSQYMLSPEGQVALSRRGFIPAITSVGDVEEVINQAMVALSQGTPYPAQPEINFYFRPLFDAFQAFYNGVSNAEEALQSAADEIIESVEYFQVSGEEY